jgi:hypothetical protein
LIPKISSCKSCHPVHRPSASRWQSDRSIIDRMNRIDRRRMKG